MVDEQKFNKSNRSNTLLPVKCYFYFLLFIIFLFNFSTAHALTLDKSTYYSTEPIMTMDEGGPIIIYSIDHGSPLGGAYSYTPGGTLDPSSITSRGDYVIVEFTTFDTPCIQASLSYDECKQIPEFVAEFLFSIIAAPFGTGGGSDEGEQEIVGKSITSYSPQIEIKSPYAGGVFSNKIPIIYSVTDQNDNDSNTKEQFGLGEKPVSIFYTDKFTRWSDINFKDNSIFSIAKDLQAVGTYVWDASNLVEQKFYQIIISAIDKANIISQTVSELFSVDITAPTFTVDINPKVAKNEKVTITVTSSEELAEAPIVSVRQREAKPIVIKVSGQDKKYVGTYDVIDGFDGTAIVEVVGTDFASNKGTVIMSGGTFNVGVNPPIKPTIIYPTNNEKVTTDTIEVRGTAREDTEVIATLNGVTVYKAKPDSNGNFTIKDVKLKKNAVNGSNILSVVSKDIRGSLSDGAVSRILFNSIPSIEISQPISKSLLSGVVSINVLATDDNNDKIYFRYEIAKAGKDLKWQTSEDVPSDKINFNTTKFTDGAYLLRVTADDGVSTSTSNSIDVNIRNETSFFIRFYDGLRTLVKENSATVRGVVFAEKSSSSRPVIKSLEYSKDGGGKWTKVLAEDGSFDSGEERFSVTITGLKKGLNNTLWRTKDSNDKIITSDQPIIVDDIAPAIAKVSFPEEGATLTKADNESGDKGEFSFTLRGESEPESNISVEVSGKKFIGKTSFDGTYRVPKIVLPGHGKYKLKITSTDQAQNASESLERAIIYNNPPVLVLTNPRDGRGVGNKTTLSWLMSDADSDTISNVILSYRRIGGEYIVLSKNPAENKFEWNTSTLAEGNNYELKLEASDGLSKASTITPFSIDRNPPSIKSFELITNTIKKGGLIEARGTAVDTDSGVEFIEYKLSQQDIGEISQATWYKANIDRGNSNKSLGKTVSFYIKSHLPLSDGNYEISIRAVDLAGNMSQEVSKAITIDNTPPRIGSFEISSQGYKLLPKGEVWSVIRGTTATIMVSLENDTKSAEISHDGTSIPLVRDFATGLWKGEISFAQSQAGDLPFYINAIDMLGNVTSNQPLVLFRVENKGKITFADTSGSLVPLSGARIVAREVSSNHSIWSIFSSSSEVSTTSDDSGEFILLLPAGDYEINVEKSGFSKVKLGKFSYENPSFFAKPISLIEESRKGLWSTVLRVLHLK